MKQKYTPKETNAEARDRALDDYQARTKSISDLMKYLGFGLIAAFYTITSEIDALPAGHVLRLVHVGTGVAGATIIITDYLHNVFAARTALIALRNPRNGHQYKVRSLNYRLGLFFYYVKQAATLTGCGLMVWLILYL